jgi:serine/threonine protein kinase
MSALLSSPLPPLRRDYEPFLDAHGQEEEEDAAGSLLSNPSRFATLVFSSLLYSARLPTIPANNINLNSLTVIGEGASSTYYRGNLKQSDPNGPALPKVVALRVANPDYPSEQTWEDLNSELYLRVVPELAGYPNIVQLYFVLSHIYSPSNPPTFAYEFAELGSLSSLLDSRVRQKSRLEAKVMASICLDIGNAVDAMRKCAITHNDLK